MSPSAETRILFVGDMHLGRHTSGLPGGLEVQPGPSLAWDNVIQAAVHHQVHCVALAGDLVNAGNDLFEAFGLLSRGVRQLTDQGIEVCAVAGNHDTRTLPEIARKIDAFHLLGAGGTWTSQIIEGDSHGKVRLVGWSFPDTHHSQSPLLDPPPVAQAGTITLGLLHGDLDSSESKYAPVSSSALKEIGYQGWCLGHIHLPGDLPHDGSPFYLGSLSPLSSKERGLHGPVLARITPEGSINYRRLPIAPMRWEKITLDCTSLTDPAGNLRGHLLTAVQGLVAELKDDLGQVQALGLQVVLTGQVHRPVALAQAVDKLDPHDLIIPDSWGTAFIQRVENEVTGIFDLAELARQDHPAGLLARHILVLDPTCSEVPGLSDPQEERARLVALGRRQLAQVQTQAVFAGLEDKAKLTDEDLAAKLRLVAHEALAHLLAGADGSGETGGHDAAV